MFLYIFTFFAFDTFLHFQTYLFIWLYNVPPLFYFFDSCTISFYVYSFLIVLLVFAFLYIFMFFYLLSFPSFFSICFAPWQETFADAGDGDGDGGGGTMWDHFKIVVGPFYEHFRTSYANEICSSTQDNFPWNGTYYFVSSIRKTSYQPLIWTKIGKNIFSTISNKVFFSPRYKQIYFWTYSYIQKITFNLIINFKTNNIWYNI